MSDPANEGMPSSPLNAASTELPPTQTSESLETAADPTDWLIWLELATVLFLCVVPHLFHTLVWRLIPHPAMSFRLQAVSLIIHSSGAIALIVFVVARSGESWNRFGLGRIRIVRDAASGIVAYFLMHFIYHSAWRFLYEVLSPQAISYLGRADLSTIARPTGAGEYALFVIMQLANGLAEESVMRAYLITRLAQVFGSTLLALLISSFLFAAYHGYQGPSGVVSTLMVGLVYGGIFCATRRVWPIAIAHAIQNIVSLG